MAQSPDAWNMPQHPTTIDLGAHDHHHHQQHHHTHREDIQEWQFKSTLLKKTRLSLQRWRKKQNSHSHAR